MTEGPDVRASDADRERTADALRQHCSDGRLTLTELDERLGEVYAARTLGQLTQALRELPSPDPPGPVPIRDLSLSRAPSEATKALPARAARRKNRR